MAGQGRNNRGGRAGHGDSSGRGRGRVPTRTKSVKTGLTKELENNIFDLGERSSADLMRNTQIKFALYIGGLYGGDIMGELDTKKEFVTTQPTFPESAESRRLKYETMIRAQQTEAVDSLTKKISRVQNRLASTPFTEVDVIEQLKEEVSQLQVKLLRARYDASSDIELPLTEEEKGEWRQSQKAYADRVQKHLLNQQKAFAIIIGQCTQRLQDKLHDDSQWEKVNKNQKPLELYTLIERVVMKQTGDEYPPHNLVDNLLAVLTMKQQNNQSNPQWYEKLNTRVDVAESVGVQFDNFSCLWEYCCEAREWKEYDTLTPDEQSTIRNDSKERLLAYLLIINSSNTATHESVKSNLLEAFIAKRDEYPITRSDAIALLNKYDERKPPPTAVSEGTAFAQKGKLKKSEDKGKKKEQAKEENDKGSDTKRVKCFFCDKAGHIASSCPAKKKFLANNDDLSSILSKSSKKEELEKIRKMQINNLCR